LTPLDFTVGSLDTPRQNLLRYQTPKFSGFSLAGSWGGDDLLDLGLWYSNDASDWQIKGGFGGVKSEGDGDPDSGVGFGRDYGEIKGSVSIWHKPSGVFVDLAGVNRDIKASQGLGALPDFSNRHVRAGWLDEVSSLGAMSVFAEFSKSNDALAGRTFLEDGIGLVSSSELDVYSIGFMQRFDRSQLVLYAMYKRYEAVARGDIGVSDFDDIDVFFVGLRYIFGSDIPQLAWGEEF
jgi:hypothetical protein